MATHALRRSRRMTAWTLLSALLATWASSAGPLLADQPFREAEAASERASSDEAHEVLLDDGDLEPPSSFAAGRSWLARAFVGWSSVSSGPNEVTLGGERRLYGALDEVAYGIEVERRFNPRLGLELGMLYSRPRLERNIDTADCQMPPSVGEATFLPITAGLDIHLTPERRVDLTLTPLAGYAFYDDPSFRLEGVGVETLSLDDDFVWGVRAALDIPFRESRWACLSEPGISMPRWRRKSRAVP